MKKIKKLSYFIVVLLYFQAIYSFSFSAKKVLYEYSEKEKKISLIGDAIIKKDGDVLKANKIFISEKIENGKQYHFGEAFDNIVFLSKKQKTKIFGDYGYWNEKDDELYISGRVKIIKKKLIIYGNSIWQYKKQNKIRIVGSPIKIISKNHIAYGDELIYDLNSEIGELTSQKGVKIVKQKDIYTSQKAIIYGGKSKKIVLLGNCNIKAYKKGKKTLAKAKLCESFENKKELKLIGDAYLSSEKGILFADEIDNTKDKYIAIGKVRGFLKKEKQYIFGGRLLYIEKKGWFRLIGKSKKACVVSTNERKYINILNNWEESYKKICIEGGEGKKSISDIIIYSDKTKRSYLYGTPIVMDKEGFLVSDCIYGGEKEKEVIFKGNVYGKYKEVKKK
jgi:lipopolysaccharide export system protein LptA